MDLKSVEMGQRELDVKLNTKQDNNVIYRSLTQGKQIDTQD